MKQWKTYLKDAPMVLGVAVSLVFSAAPLSADILIGATGSYNALTASQDYGGPTKSLNTFEDSQTVHSGSGSLFLQSAPEPLIPHIYWAPYFDVSTLQVNTSEAYLQSTTGVAGVGLYFATGNLYRGNVGFFLGIIAAGRISSLEGEFNFGRSTLYETYLNLGEPGGLDHIDILNYSRDQSGNLSDARKTRYLLLKSGAISRENYIVADIAFNRKVDFKSLALLALLGNNLNNIHKYYMLDNEATEKSDVFYGAAPTVELGYMGSNYLIKYKAGFPMRYRSGKGSMAIETHSLTIGVFLKI